MILLKLIFINLIPESKQNPIMETYKKAQQEWLSAFPYNDFARLEEAATRSQCFNENLLSENPKSVQNSLNCNSKIELSISLSLSLSLFLSLI